MLQHREYNTQLEDELYEFPDKTKKIFSQNQLPTIVIQLVLLRLTRNLDEEIRS